MKFRRQVLYNCHWDITHSYCEKRYVPNQKTKHFGFRKQFICMVFAQLTWREGLRDIETCLNARSEYLNHLGFEKPTARLTLAEANEQRDWRIWQDLGLWLVAKARKLRSRPGAGKQHLCVRLNDY